MLCRARPAAAAAASPVGVAHLELRAEVNAQQAQSPVSQSAAAAITAVKHSERSLTRAYTRIAGKSSATVSVPVSVAARFTAAADDQAANLAQVVDDGRGALEAVAATALAKTATMDANVVGSVTTGIDDAQTSPSPAAGQQLAELGADQAALNATLSFTASSEGHSAAVQDVLDVRVERSGPDLCVVVADQGEGMVPRTDSPGVGLGLPIIASLAHRLEVISPGTDGRTEVHMYFPCDRHDAKA